MHGLKKEEHRQRRASFPEPSRSCFISLVFARVCSLNSHFGAGNNSRARSKTLIARKLCVKLATWRTGYFCSIFFFATSVSPFVFVRCRIFYLPTIYRYALPSLLFPYILSTKRAVGWLCELLKAQPSGLFALFRSGLLAHRRFND